MTWAAPDTEPNGELVFKIACLNGKVIIGFLDGKFSVKLIPAANSGIKEQQFAGPPTGIAVEVDMFARAIRGVKDEEQYGRPKDAMYDLAVIQALLCSDGKEIDLTELVGN